MNQRGIGVSNLPNLKYKNVCIKGINFNLLLVGQNGIGKTSFINGLLNTKVIDISKDHSPNQVWTFTLVENEFKTNMRVTEIDCVGDSLDNDKCWIPIIKYINECYSEYYTSEQENVRSVIQDKRVHLCLYFLEPNVSSIRESDLCCMKEISNICNLIPIVSKSDLLKHKQIQECFDYLRRVFDIHEISLYEEKDSKQGDIESFIPPFFVVNPDRHLNTSRKYSYGSLMLSSHITNDLYRLRDHLISKNILSLMEKTEEYYDIYRTTTMYGYINHKASENLNKELLSASLMDDLKKEQEKLKEIRRRVAEKKRLIINKDQ